MEDFKLSVNMMTPEILRLLCSCGGFVLWEFFLCSVINLHSSSHCWQIIFYSCGSSSSPWWLGVTAYHWRETTHGELLSLCVTIIQIISVKVSWANSKLEYRSHYGLQTCTHIFLWQLLWSLKFQVFMKIGYTRVGIKSS